MEQNEELLKRAETQERIAKDFGFYWESLDQLIEQIQSECQEIKEAWEKNDRNHLKEEVGDLLLAGISLAIFCRLDPHDTLKQSIEKFQIRYDKLVSLVHQEGLESLKGQSLEVLLNYWKKAK